MLKTILLVLFIAATPLSFAKSKSIYFINDEDIAQAAKYFKEGQYAEAQAIYLDLASAGDKYAQYILSVIELHGLIEEPNLIKAYAWAKVAKENTSKHLVKHFKTIAKQVPSEHQEEFQKASTEIYMKHSNIAVAKRYLRYTKEEFPKCTGSRTGLSIAACEKIRVICNSQALDQFVIPDLAGNKRCMDFAAKIRTENLLRMKNDINQLQSYVQELEQKTGTVTISDESE
ncbi:hypothetical protein DZA50_05150 [Kangiella sp. HD9-110m-PIT-SAG07]|nr:hypothetical protein DZA50_05150 [Kangiella sp. HD9-110m-PIT-SAG07]